MTEAIRIEIESERCSRELVDEFAATMAAVTGSFEEREAKALQLGNEIVRRWLERELQSIADEIADEVVVAGERYRRHDRGTRRYHTLCGTVVVSRESYRFVGIHNGS